MKLTYPISEIFESFQGEWPNIWKPCIFIRFFWCNLKCDFCFWIKPWRKIPDIITSEWKNKQLNKVWIWDKLITYDNNMNLVETKVIEVYKREVDIWYEIKINNQTYFITPEHPFFTTKWLIIAEKLKVWDMIYHSKINDKLSLTELKANWFEVQSIKRIDRNDKKYKYEYFKPKKLKVYNLSCSPYNTYLIDNMRVHNCDSTYASREDWDYKMLKLNQIIEKILHYKSKHIIFTWWEPSLYEKQIETIQSKLINCNFTYEIETNWSNKLHNYYDQINVSPKLLSSWNKKYDLKVDREHWENIIYKFVAENERDFNEIKNYIEYYDIPKEKIYIMPKWITLESQRNEQVIKFCKKEWFKFSSRLHIMIYWNKRWI